METNIKLASIFFLGALAVGCGDKVNREADAQNSSSSVGAEKSYETQERDVATPNDEKSRESSSHELQAVQPEVGASSWQVMLSQLTRRDRNYLIEVDSRYFGTMQFSDLHQREDLLRMGFPSPEEWLKARMLTDIELLNGAKSGNASLQKFHVDRVMETLGEDARSGLSDNLDDIKKFNVIADASVMALENVARTRSPFAVYQAAAFMQSMSQDQSPSIAAGSFQLAKELGDKRAGQLSDVYFSQNPDINPQAMMASYALLKSHVRD